MYGWDTLPWKEIQRDVFKLQKRIYQASRRGDVIDIVTTPKRPETLTVGEGMNDKHQVVEEPCKLETVRRGTRG
jgi:hypothetical protein